MKLHIWLCNYLIRKLVETCSSSLHTHYSYVNGNQVKQRLNGWIRKNQDKAQEDQVEASWDGRIGICMNVGLCLECKSTQDDVQVKGGKWECSSMADAWHRASSPLVTATWIAKYNPVINPSSVSHSAPYILFDTHVHWRFPFVGHNNYWSYNTFHRSVPECWVVKVWRR